ncbi:MAG: PAC2 family protein [Promethearchaeia archaeon]
MSDSGIKIIKHLDSSNMNLNKPIAILGMPGIADIGKFALDSLVGQLNAEHMIDIIFDGYPAGAIVDDSLLSVPKAEILLWRDPDNVRDILLVTADAQSLTPKGIYKISNFLTEQLFKMGTNLIIALGGYPVNGQNINSKVPKIYCTSTNQKLLNDYIQEDVCEKIQKGVIIGANGLIPTLSKARYTIDGLVFLAETDNIAMVNEDITDLKASIALLDMLKSTFMLPIKNKFNMENIENINKDLQSKKDQLERELDKIQLVDSKDEKRKSLYI